MLQITDLSTPLIGPISLAVAPGECVALLGSSGAGKSLFLRAVADLDPNQGQVSLDGRDRDAMPAPEWRRLVALVPAETGWWADRVGEHFDPRADFAALLAAVGLPEALGWEVARLSTGERQRLGLVRALGQAPRALLLDEPTAALDQAATGQVEGLIAAERARGAPVLMVTHDAAQAARLATRTFRIEAGLLQPAAEATT